MSLPFFNDDRDGAPQFSISCFEGSRLRVESWVVAATDVEQLNTSLGQRVEALERLGFRHITMEDRVLGIDATDFV